MRGFLLAAHETWLHSDHVKVSRGLGACPCDGLPPAAAPAECGQGWALLKLRERLSSFSLPTSSGSGLFLGLWMSRQTTLPFFMCFCPELPFFPGTPAVTALDDFLVSR